ncbi:hypothetical protein ACUXQ2_006248 [Cupriavidus metallidurans]|uniref:hypothetical protein n=1 Tax=Cupriavidus metallidurans TaxID=119219 RepID=UPI00056D447D|nr:hypothetical protein [Cupriavidus metallidurans]HBD37907.1 hypothetical protein [Cupriavidus sp.]
MGTKPEAKSVKKAGDLATFDEFRAGVSYLLVHDHGMPEVVARDVLEGETEYLQQAFQDGTDRRPLLTEVAEELAFKPRSGGGWIRTDEDHLLLEVNERVRVLLDGIAKTGLYGGTPEEVAQALLCRGIETVLPVAQSLGATGRLG